MESEWSQAEIQIRIEVYIRIMVVGSGYAVSRFQQLAEDEALNFKLGKWAQQVGLSVKWD